jgi:hypothetical protein
MIVRNDYRHASKFAEQSAKRVGAEQVRMENVYALAAQEPDEL